MDKKTGEKLFKETAQELFDLGWGCRKYKWESGNGIDTFAPVSWDYDFYDGGGINLLQKESGKVDEWGERIGFSYEYCAASHACGIPNFCGFSDNLDEDLPPHDVMVKAIQLGIYRNGYQGYIQASTITKAGWKPITDALIAAGFKEVARVKTRHLGERHKIIILEWKA